MCSNVLQAFRIHSFNVHGRGFVRIVIYNAGMAQTLAAKLDLYIKLADDLHLNGSTVLSIYIRSIILYKQTENLLFYKYICN